MLRKIAIAVGLVAWFFAVFVVSWFATFPSPAVAEFAAWRVQEGTDLWRLSASGIGPSGFGVRADDVVLSKKDRAGIVPVVEAEHVYLSSGPWSLLNLVTGGKSTIKGSIVRQGGDLSFSTTIARADQGVKVHAASLDADELPLAALPPMSGARLKGKGGIDVHVDLEGEEGLAKSNGKVTIAKGEELVIEGLEAPGTPLDGVQIGTVEVSVFDVAFDVKGGKGKVASGVITTNLANIEVQGDFTLSDVLPQSRLRLKLLVTLTEQFDTQLGTAGALAKGLMGQTWADGAYHFALSGTAGMPRFRVERERKASSRPAGSVSRPVDDEGDEEGAPPAPIAPLVAPPVGDAAADRTARREQAIADRRARMEERRRQLQAGGAPDLKRPMVAPGEVLKNPDDEFGAPPIEEELPEEDLPPGVPEEGEAEEY